jgi:putative serine protease PepD
MSDNDRNEQRPNEPAEPVSGASADETHDRPAAQPTEGAGEAQQGWRPPYTGADANGGSAAQPANRSDGPAAETPAADETTSPQPYGGSGGQPGSYPSGPYQPGANQPGPYAAGAYPTAQYPQPGYGQAHPTTGGGYPGGPTTGAGYGYGQAYGQPVPTTNAGSGRGGRTRTKVAAGVLGVLLAVGGGLAGAAWMHELDGNNTTPVSAVGAGGAPDTAPIIDRSSLASIAAAVRPSVVSITTSNATGSGVVISADGYVLTNNHVAQTANGQSVQITLSDGSTVPGKLIGTDAKTDLAVFQAQNLTKKLAPAKFGDSGALRVGDTVLAIGSPLGLDGSVTSGIVSALNRTIDESSDSQPQDPFGQQGQQQNSTPGATIAGAIQTDAAINPGNSGGALVNTNGEVVGINTAIATDGSSGNIGVGFAIPSNRAKTVSQDIIKGVAVQHPYLGIGVVTASNNGGAQVQQVTSGSPAASAGLKVGDVVTAYNGHAVHTSDDLVNDVQAGNVNDKVTLTVQRSGSSTQVGVTLGESK